MAERPEDLNLPNSIVARIIKESLPEGVNVSKEARTAIAKAASGCLELVQIAKVTNIKHTIEALKNKGFWIVGLDSEGQNSLKEVVDIDKVAVIIGSEGKGMRKLTSESCDFLTKIPISDKVESLNASNAASIIFHLLNLHYI